MLRKIFDHELQKVKENILILGSMVEDSILNSVVALKHRDAEGAQGVADGNVIIIAKSYAIENQILTIIAMQQPMARDLRILASALEITQELKRIGSYGRSIAITSLRIGNQTIIRPLIDIAAMADIATSMLHRALGAFCSEDVVSARAIPLEDDDVDNLYIQFYRVLMTSILQHPEYCDQISSLLWAAHCLERTADRVTNICERTIFVSTGLLNEISDYKYEHILAVQFNALIESSK
jgi:phosphate transport system protein